jgi:tetratricopeptide (TPR) repeat protein
MQTLRLTQSIERSAHRIDITLTGDGAHRSATARFEWRMNPQDQEDVRWYLEDYLGYPVDPAPEIAARVEQRMDALGRDLFASVFQANHDAQRLWETAVPRLSDVRVEVASAAEGAAAVPWEVLRDPATGQALALGARAFVRIHPEPSRQARGPAAGKAIRVLLVLCRPDKDADVPFRSVASRLVRLTNASRELVRLDVLRPPTFARLTEVLRTAAQRGDAYQVVHFDGHGIYADLGIGAGRRGYLVFEDPGIPGNAAYIDGRLLGELLVDSGVPLLVLNACRSAYAELTTEPQAADRDTDQRVQAYGSLAQEVVGAGVSGVVAMRYNVYVVTAAQFVGDLYAALAAGQTLGAAVTAGRCQLARQPGREIAFPARPLQDWIVPVVFETAPLALVPDLSARAITREQASVAAGRFSGGSGGPNLPLAPDAGFYGRDETMLGLDRAFDDQQIVLLHAWAGAGKTAAAVEFARWYQLTGGLENGPVLFTSFTHYMPLTRVLDQAGTAFERWWTTADMPWLALSDSERRARALETLGRVPVLWIWDNVEPVAGFPAGTPSAWTADEQRELAGFLRELRGTKAKVLLTSRRDERSWLGDLPVRLTLPPMPMAERFQLTRAIAEKHGHQLTEVADWRPLLEFTQGNPLTITVLGGQALRFGLRSGEETERFATQLRKGAAEISDDIAQGRDKSLASSLGYGFNHAFTDHEHAQLALLRLFQGFVDADVLAWMGDPASEYCVPELRGLTAEQAAALLARAEEIGLLTSVGEGGYEIHPALPRYLRLLFAEHYGTSQRQPVHNAMRAYVGAISDLGSYYNGQYGDGRTDVIGWLGREEANLMSAREIARSNGWVEPVIGAMQGLSVLYQHTGRLTEWKRLVDEFPQGLVEASSGGPLPGLETEWAVLTRYRAELARDALNLAEAERLQRVLVDWRRKQAAAALATPPGAALDEERRDTLSALAVSVENLGHLLREQRHVSCIEQYREALSLHRRIGDQQAQSILAFNLGSAYLKVPSLRDLDEAEHWYQLSFELCPDSDRLARAKTTGQLGSLAYERFKDLFDAGAPDEQLLRHLNESAAAYQAALDLLPDDAASDLSIVHFQLGAINTEAGDLDSAMAHYRESARYGETLADPYAAGQILFNIAFALSRAGRYQDALLYARASLRDFEQVGPGTAEATRRARELIAEIEPAPSSDEDERHG